jgi:hypothetical protein
MTARITVATVHDEAIVRSMLGDSRYLNFLYIEDMPVSLSTLSS